MRKVFVSTRWPSAVITIDTVTKKQRVSVLPGGDRNPLGLAVDSRTGTVWIAESLPDSAGRDSVASLNTAGAIREYRLPDVHAKQYPRDIAIDVHGYVWLTSSSQPTIYRIDPRSGSVQAMRLTYASPSLVSDSRGEIWFVEGSRTRINRLRGGQAQLMLSLSNYYIAQLSSDGAGKVWFVAISHDVPQTTSLIGYIDIGTGLSKLCQSRTETEASVLAASSRMAVFANRGQGASTMTPECKNRSVQVMPIESAAAERGTGIFWVLSGNSVWGYRESDVLSSARQT